MMTCPLHAAFLKLEGIEDVASFQMYGKDHRNSIRNLVNDIPVCGMFMMDDISVLCFSKDFTFYTKDDALHAMRTGTLYLSYGNLSCPEGDAAVGFLVSCVLRQQRLRVMWNGCGRRRLRVRLTREDLAYLRYMALGKRGLARFHRMVCVWEALKRGVKQSKQDTLQLCFCGWAHLPGQPGFKRARADFASLLPVF